MSLVTSHHGLDRQAETGMHVMHNGHFQHHRSRDDPPPTQQPQAADQNSANDLPVDVNPPKDEDEAQKNLKDEEKQSFGVALGSLTLAMTNPRAFFMQMKPIQLFVVGLKEAIKLSPNQGYCLASGEFRDYGCAEDGKTPQLCKCKGMLDMCYLPTDESKIVSMVTSGDMNGAMEHAKSLLLGQCYTPVWLVCLVWGGLGLLLCCCSCCAWKIIFSKKRADDDDS